MPSDEGPIVQSARLRRELVRLRSDAQLTQEEVARQLDWSPMKLLRIEAGHSSIRTVDLDALLRTYGDSSESTRERLQAINREARGRGWWSRWQRSAGSAVQFFNYIGHETGATCIRQSPGMTVPDLLQTAEYAKACIAGLVDIQLKQFGSSYRDSSYRVDELVELRMQRQSELTRRSTPPSQYYYLDEGVIRRHVAVERDPIMPEQLRYIADRAEVDELVTVQVIPFTAGSHAGMYGQFTWLEFDGDLPTKVYIGAGPEMVVKTGGDWGAEIDEYMEIFEALHKIALPAQESVEFIRQAVNDMS